MLKLNNSILKSILIFAMAYTFFVLYLFNRDVSNTDVLQFIVGPAKYLSLIILIISVFFNKYTKKQLLSILFILLIDVVIFIQSGALTFVFITLLTMSAINIENKTIIKIAFCTLLFYLVVTIIFWILGIYPDVITHRFVGTRDRHSLRFYHSNVLPLVYSYLVGYGLILNNTTKKKYFLIILGAGCLFYICNSRNAFFITILIVFSKFLVDSSFLLGKTGELINNLIYFIAKYIVGFLFIFSIVAPLILEKSSLISIIDCIFSYRFTLTLNLIESTGLYLLPQMTNEMFFSNGIIIDNGYAFIAIRYGLLIALLLSVVVYITAKHYKKNTFVLMIIILVSMVNIIDNDILDYSCLPYLIIAEKCIIAKLSRKKMHYGRTYKRNNEYLQRRT